MAHAEALRLAGAVHQSRADELGRQLGAAAAELEVLRAKQVRSGLGRITTLYPRPATPHHIYEYIRWLCF